MSVQKSFSFQYRRIAGILLIIAMLIALTLPQAVQASSNWFPLGSGLNGSVNALVFDGSGNLYVGGSFTTAGGAGANYIAKWDGSSWSAVGSGLGDTVKALVFDGSGNLYAGGNFITAGGINANHIAKWDGSSWSALGSGMNYSVNALTFGDGNLYAGGSFSTAGGTSASRIAKWNGSSWSALGSGVSSNAGVSVLAFGGGNLYAGGSFTTAGGVSANQIAKWNGDSWSAMGSGMNSEVYAFAFDGSGNVFAGGRFTTAGGTSNNHIAKWDGSSWSALGSGVNGTVNTLAFDGSGNLYTGGSFTTAGGTNINNIAKWNGSSWSALGSGVNGITVSELEFDGGGSLYVGGYFTAAGGTSAKNIAKVIFLPTPDQFSKTSPINNALYQPINPILSWGISDLATSYEYCYDTINNDACDTSWVSAGLNTNTNLSDLSYSTAYFWQVKAINAEGTAYSNNNNWWNFTTRASGTSLVVTDTSDNGAGSLRQIIFYAVPGDVITFAPGLSGGIIRLASVLTLSKNVTIDGSALVSPITISGDSDGNGTGNVPVFYVNSGVTASLKNLAITKGSKLGGSGGGIYNSGILTVADCTIFNNEVWGADTGAHTGAGISNGGTLTITNSTISGNTVYPNSYGFSYGGGISNGGTLTITNSAISGNRANFSGYGDSEGGGIYNSGTLAIANSTFSTNLAYNGVGIYNHGMLTLTNSTFSDNVTNIEFGTLNYANTILLYCDSVGTIGTNTRNLVKNNSNCGTPYLVADPNLGPLTENGGLTQTMALLAGSPAIDAGDTASCPATDQRGVARPQDGDGNGSEVCDIGAYEYSATNIPPTISDITDKSTTENIATGFISFAVGDVDTSIISLTVTATSSNTTLVPNGNITLGVNGTSRTINIMPALDQIGTTTITVTVNDGITTTSDTFLLTVNKLSTNANLSNLVFSTGSLAPTFDSATTTYTQSVTNATSSLTVTPTVADAAATVKVNTVTVTSGSASGAIALAVGPNTITTVVTAEDGKTTKTYTVTVTRAPADTTMYKLFLPLLLR